VPSGARVSSGHDGVTSAACGPTRSSAAREADAVGRRPPPHVRRVDPAGGDEVDDPVAELVVADRRHERHGHAAAFSASPEHARRSIDASRSDSGAVSSTSTTTSGGGLPAFVSGRLFPISI